MVVTRRPFLSNVTVGTASSEHSPASAAIKQKQQDRERHHYIIRGGVKGRERLRALARVMQPTTLNLFARVGIKPGMACLDVGCGGGDVTFDLADLVGPKGRAVGWDIDETKLNWHGAKARRSNTAIWSFDS